MKIEVSNGELLDRISILELKKLKIDNPSKLANVEMQFYKINPLCVKLFEENDSTLQSTYLRLAKINGILWDLENKVRDPKIEVIIIFLTIIQLKLITKIPKLIIDQG